MAILRSEGTTAIDTSIVPITTLVVTTMALNVLALALPLASQQVFNRIVPNPGTPTMMFLIVGVLACAALDALLRLGRTYLISEAGSRYAIAMVRRVLGHAIEMEPRADDRRDSRGLEYIAAVHHLKEYYNGQVIISIIELIFIPIVLILIFFISVSASTVLIVAVAAVCALTFRDAMHLRAAARGNIASSEELLGFLFSVLSSMHLVKAMAVEGEILRRYEQLQGKRAYHNHDTALVIGRLMNSGQIANHVITALMLVWGGLLVGSGDVTIGTVSAVVLLSGRVMAPLQRAMFLLVQTREIESARADLAALFARATTATPDATTATGNVVGRIDLDGVDVADPITGERILEGVSLSLMPGECISIFGPSEAANAALLRVIAGTLRPTNGEVRIDGIAPTAMDRARLNRTVAYIPANGVLFRGTIRDNITRFGEVSVNEAMSVAALLEADVAINELPRGLDTALMGSVMETIPPGLRQQLTIVRALATRPRVILFDNADRGLDRESYARFGRFIGLIHGQAAMIIVSEDANLADHATRSFSLVGGRLTPVLTAARTMPTAYRDLVP